MGQRLREIAKHFICFGVVFLRKKAQVVCRIEGLLENLVSFFYSTLSSKALCKPERTRKEGPLYTGQPVITRRVPAQKTSLPKIFPDCIGGTDHPFVVVINEINGGQ